MGAEHVYLSFAVIATWATALLDAPTVQSATLSELVAHYAAAANGKGTIPAGTLLTNSRSLPTNSEATKNRWRPVNPDPPWVSVQQADNPPTQAARWAYGQSRVANDPYSWRFRGGNFMRSRWRNPMAPWANAEIQRWWHQRTGVANYYQSNW